MKLKIKKAIVDGFNALKETPIIILIGLIYAIASFLLKPDIPTSISNGSNASFFDIFSPLNILKIITISLIGIFTSGVMTVLSAKGKKVSLISATNLVASRYLILLLATILGFALTFLGLVALILPGIFVFIKLSYYEPAVLLNNKGILESLKISWNITRGNWWRIFALFILLVLVSWGIMAVTDLFSTTATDFFYNIFLFPWFVAVFTKSYLQLKR